jgi:hypothetical protein
VVVLALKNPDLVDVSRDDSFHIENCFINIHVQGPFRPKSCTPRLTFVSSQRITPSKDSGWTFCVIAEMRSFDRLLQVSCVLQFCEERPGARKSLPLALLASGSSILVHEFIPRRSRPSSCMSAQLTFSSPSPTTYRACRVPRSPYTRIEKLRCVQTLISANS